MARQIANLSVVAILKGPCKEPQLWEAQSASRQLSVKLPTHHFDKRQQSSLGKVNSLQDLAAATDRTTNPSKLAQKAEYDELYLRRAR
ncbi:hypothetical protein CVT26_008783 [Gymnopilus dilepis]|uniref:Uncharacterized protein n=1 Tax=Gymnopilus dilepis TaxID=231916 RepID=A0A409W9M7_9AGAR|nr:hypothetical protein CVT26_008783 [Gymnopilus dilepis]